jgi:hypothetical protein
VVKENLQECLKAVPSTESAYKLVIGSKLNFWTILTKSYFFFRKYSEKKLQLLASDSMMQVHKTTEL